MTDKRSHRAGGWFAAALLTLGAILAPSVAAAAVIEPGDSVYVGSKQGYGGTGLFPIWSSGTQTGDPDYWAYCVEHDVTAETGLQGQVTDLDGYLGANYFTDSAVQGKVLWVLAHSYPALSLEEFGAAAGVPGISRNDAIEATQYAIWRYTDLTFDAAWAFETPGSEAAYWYLVNGANANPGLTPDAFEVTASITAPAGAQVADSLVGPFTVSTNQPTVSVSVNPALPLTDSSGTAIDPDAIVDGQELYLDLRGTTTAGSATVEVTAAGSSSTGRIVSVPKTAGGTPTEGDHAQTIVLITPSTTKTSAQAAVSWSGDAVPTLGTSLVDSADGDQVLPWNGGTAIDTVTYDGLVPGTEYTLVGELMRKSDGSSTGIDGSITFTPTAASGSVDVTFAVPTGYAGSTLVAFERLFEGADTSGEPIAEHADIDDAAQTVTVENQPAPAPAIGTSLVDASDGDRVLPWDGGTVVDTVAYRNLTPGTEYTVSGELIRKSDGTGTGIVGSTTFTPTAPDGSVQVTFVVPKGHAGETLVAFERLHVGTDTAAQPVAVHEDIDDAAQTVTIGRAPAVAPTTPDGGGDLAATGSEAPIVPALLAAVALLAGAALLVIGRRRRAGV